MDVIYYYYYLFYKKILKDDEPHLLTTMALSASEGFAFNVSLNIFFTRYFCLEVNKWVMFITIILFNILNYLYFHKSGKAKRIIKLQPKFFSSHRLSIILTLIFFIVTLSFLFCGGPVSRNIMEIHCR